MSIKSIICVYLLSCFSSDQSLNDCPNNCQCFSAPEGGNGEDTALSLICKWDDIINPIHFRSLRNKKTINTFVLDNVRNERTGGRAVPYKIFTDLSIKNLVFRDSTFYFSSDDFEGLNNDYLNVITFINTNLLEKSGTGVDFSSFGNFKQIKAIYFSDGSFPRITNQFHQMSVQNVIFLSIKRAKLNSIDKNAFEKFKSLKMLTISENQIKSLDWMLTIVSPLWYLDLRNNQINTFTLQLAEKLTKLKTLQLGGNNIHWFTGNTMDLLIERLRELSFEPIKNGITNKQYFYLTKDMQWIYRYIHKHNDYANNPTFLSDSLNKHYCVKWDQDPQYCHFWDLDDFEYPYEAITEHLAAGYFGSVDGYSLSYLNKKIILSGANIPFKNTLDMYWLDRVAEMGGNTIKIYLDTNIWYDFKESGSQDFKQMINKLKMFLSEAQNKDIFVIINLWKSSLMMGTTILFKSDDVFEQYSNNHLKPLVTELNQFKSLAAWNIIDDPDRLVTLNENSEEPCYDTVEFERSSHLDETFSIKSIQKFIARQAQIIHEIEPRKLVTVAFNEHNTFYSNGNKFNYFEDRCLKISLDGKCTDNNCILDIYSVQLKEFSELYKKYFQTVVLSENSPKPIILIADENTNNIQEFYTKAISYNGFLATFNEDKDKQSNKIIDKGMEALKNAHPQFIRKPNDKSNIV